MTNLMEKKIGLDSTDSEVVVSVENLSKKFCRDLKTSLFYGLQDIATEFVARRRKSHCLRQKEFWALKDISFELRRGEALGLVGSNGAGKSTLLRIISGLIKPDTGRVKVRGRIAPLIALGAGFNPILTGRENIYANMSILGLSTREIEKRFDDVVEFAEIGDAIDAPVQTYSSGMAARLGFACAIHIEPDILLIDEVLAVGDIKFRMKCHRQLARLRQNGTAFILVSHNLHTILNVCQSSIYLVKGELVLAGETSLVMKKHEEDFYLTGLKKTVGALFLPEKPESESTGLDILSVYFQNEQGDVITTPCTGESVYLCLECKAYKQIKNATLSVIITDTSTASEHILYLTSAADNHTLEVFPGMVDLKLHLPYCCLQPGFYSAKIFVREGTYSFDGVETFQFVVNNSKNLLQSLFYQPRDWQVINHKG